MPPEISFSSSGSWALAEMPSALKPIDSDSHERDDAADDGQAQDAVALEHRDQRERLHLDLAERRLLGIEALLGKLLGQRLANGDGPRRDAAHHHALEDGLAADGCVAKRLERRRRLRRHGLLGHGLLGHRYSPRARLAARRLKRSTRPPVSTSFCRPV